MGVALLMRAALTLTLGLVVALATAPSPAAGVEAPIVRRIVVRSETPVDRAEIEPLLAMRVGTPLESERVRRTLRALRLSGIASEVEISTRPAADGVEVEIVLRPDLQVAQVEVKGNSGIDAAKLVAVVAQKRGQPLREDRVLRGLYQIEERLEAEGWAEASVRLEVAPAEVRGAVRVVYHVEAGARTQIGLVQFEGLGPLPAAEAIEVLHARPNEPYRAAVVREDAERLQRWLFRKEFLTASVAPAEERAVPQLPSGAQGPRIDLVWRVARGPRFVVEIVGAERRALEKRGLLPFLSGDGFDEALLLQAIGDLRTYYQQKGHYRVEVKESRTTSAGLEILRLEIVPGPRFVLDELRFEGNAVFDAARLETLVATSPRRMIELERGRLVDAELAEDLTNLRSFYALQGFDHARVGPARIEEVGRDGLRVVIPVNEGGRRLTGSIDIRGLVTVAKESIIAALPLAPGEPFHRLLLDASVDAIRARLESHGFGDALVEPRIEWTADDTVANVEFSVLEGPRSTVETIVVRGNGRTDTGVIRRFVDLHTGDPISNDRLLEVQRALYRLGVFARVDVRAPAPGAALAPREVLVEVEEGRVRSVAYGAGYDSEDGARGLFRFAHANLGGRAASFQLDALVAQRNQLYRGLFRQPYLASWPVVFRAVAYRQVEDRPHFQVGRSGGLLGLEREYGALRIGLATEYRIVELTTDASDEVIPLESRDARVASLTPTLIWDHRDDPIDPTRGWSATLQLESAFPVANADANYRKLFAQWTGYRPLGRSIFALSLRGGAMQPQGTPADLEGSAIDLVPVAELYFAGGRTTHRAFARDELGIMGQTLALDDSGGVIARGGGALALVNLEWRFPIVGALGGDLFVDGGNVWREVADFDLNDFRWGVGVGLRYASPIGPLRVEIGWKLDRQPFEDGYQAFVSLGNAF